MKEKLYLVTFTILNYADLYVYNLPITNVILTTAKCGYFEVPIK